jgi:hypothetical protein
MAESIEVSLKANTSPFETALMSSLNFAKQIFVGIDQAAGKSAKTSASVFEKAFLEIRQGTVKTEDQFAKSFTNIYQKADKSAKDSASVFKKYWEDLARNSKVSFDKIGKIISDSIKSGLSGKSAKDSFSIFSQAGLIPELGKLKTTYEKVGKIIADSMKSGLSGKSAKDSASVFEAAFLPSIVTVKKTGSVIESMFAQANKSAKQSADVFAQTFRERLVTAEKTSSAIARMMASSSTGRYSARESASVFMNAGMMPPIPPRNSIISSASGGGGSNAGAAGMAAMGTSAASTLSVLAKMGSVITGIYAGVQLVNQAWDQVKGTVSAAWGLVQKGLEYNNTIEESTFGMAGLISQLATVNKGQMEVTDSAAKWGYSLEIAKRLTGELQGVALRTRSVYSELARGMQEGLGPMLAAGVKENDLIPFVERFVKVMGGLRVPIREMGQEIRGLMAGDTNARTSRVGASLFSQWLIEGKKVKDEMQKLIASGGFTDWFMKQTEGLGKAGEAAMSTMAGIQSNFREALERGIGEGTLPFYEKYKGVLTDLTDILFKFDEQGKVTFNQNFIDAISGVATAFGNVADKLLAFTKEFIRPGGILDMLKLTANGIAETVNPKKDSLFDLLNQDATRIVDTATAWWGQQWNDTWTNTKNIANTDYGVMGNLHPAILANRAIAYTFSPKENEMQGYLGDVQRYGLDGGKLSRFRNLVEGSGDLAPQGPSLYHTVENPAAHMSPNTGANAILTEEQIREAERKNKEYAEAIKRIEKMAFGYQRSQFTQQRDFKLEESLKPEVWKEYQKVLNNSDDAAYEFSLQYKELEKVVGEGNPILENAKKKFDAWQRSIKDAAGVREGRASSLATFGDWSSMYNVDAFNEASREKEERGYAIASNAIAASVEVAAKEALEAAERSAKVWADEMEKNFRGPLTNAFTAMAQGGAKAFMESMQQNFDTMVSDGAEKFSGKLANWITSLGGATQDAQGNWVNAKGNPASAEQIEKSQRYGRYAQQGMGFMQIGLGAYQNAKAGYNGSITQGAISGGMAGMMYSWPAAIAAAIVGAVSAAVSKADTRANYKFIAPRIKNGEADLFSSKNINPAEQEAMIARIQETFDKFWSGYMKLATRLGPGNFTSQENQLNRTYWIQPEASANMLKHFEEWLAGTLPDEIAKTFKEPIGTVFQSLGMTADKFNEIWDQFDRMEPTKALEMLNLVADTLENFNKV